MGRKGVDFRIATALFVVLTGLLLAERRRRSFAGLSVAALVLALGCYFVMVHLLSVDFP
jgi:hypothetical protein